jgi:cytochrome d ubiquinol oxidase subunit II
MLIAALIFVPIILGYTCWVYRVLRGKVTAAYIRENSKELY